MLFLHIVFRRIIFAASFNFLESVMKNRVSWDQKRIKNFQAKKLLFAESSIFLKNRRKSKIIDKKPPVFCSSMSDLAEICMPDDRIRQKSAKGSADF